MKNEITIKSEFNLMDHVIIEGDNLPGVIMEIRLTNTNAIMYLVQYWFDGSARFHAAYAEELKASIK